MNSYSFKTKLGWITISEINNKLTSVKFGKEINKGKSEYLRKSKQEILNYLNGDKKIFSLNISLKGSVLQKRIWKELLKISYGCTKTYGEIAKSLNTSPRYVGNVCGQNNHLLIIPCHRVIRSDGELGGYSGSGGIKQKRKLLENEGYLI